MEVLDARSPGHGIRLEDIRAGLRNGFPWHRADDPHPYPGDRERWWEAVERLIADALAGAGVRRGDCRALAREVRTRFVDPSIGWRLFDDAVPALTTMAEFGWTNAIVSNHVPELPELVAGVGLDAHVDAIFTSALVGFDKPNPAFFERVAEAYGKPREVWMVGDNPAADVAGAEAVGFHAILVRTRPNGVRHHAAGLMDAARIILGRHARAGFPA